MKFGAITVNLGVVFIIISLVLLIAGISLYCVYQNRILKDKEKLSVELFKNNGKFILLGGGLFIIGLIFACLAFFYDENNINYFNGNGLSYITPLNGFYVYLGIILVGVFLFTLLTSMIYLLYLPQNKKYHRYILFTFILSIVLLVGFFLMFMEGLSPYLQYPLANQILFSSNGITMIYNVGKYDIEGFHFSIALYALFIIGGACLVLYICDYQLYKVYGNHGLITACFFIAFPSGIIGARAWYVIGEWYRFQDNPWDMFRIWDGGLAIMGGAVFGIIVGVLFMIILKIYNPRYKKMDYFLLIDLLVPTILLAQGVGRIGNFFNCEVHGVAVDASYWSFLPSFIKNNMHYSSVSPTLGSNKIYVPLFLIEAITNWIGYFFIEFGIRSLFGINKHFKHDYHANGSCAGWYIVWYGITRAVLEPMRDKKFNMGQDGNWSIDSAYYMIGIGLLIVIIFIVLKVLKEKNIIKLQWDKYNEEENKNERPNA